MKKIKTFENFKNTMIGNIFTSDFDKSINDIFQEIKNDFDFNNISGGPLEKYDGFIEYNLNGTKIQVRDDTFFAIPGYTIMINDEDIKCSYLEARKMYNFLIKKWKEKEKEDVNLNLTDLGRASKKYNL